MHLYMSAAAFALLLATGCASTSTAPNEKAESSSAAIRAAEEVGAKHDAQAALHLQLAKEQFAHARSMKNPDDKAAADRLLQRAQADAELAVALSRSESVKAEADAALYEVQQLKESSGQ